MGDHSEPLGEEIVEYLQTMMKKKKKNNQNHLGDIELRCLGEVATTLTMPAPPPRHLNPAYFYFLIFRTNFSLRIIHNFGGCLPF